MVAGFALTVYPFLLKMRDHPCATSYTFLYLAFIVYGSLFILFIHFFYNTYFEKGKTERPKKVD